jgi:hypothetical protein
VVSGVLTTVVECLYELMGGTYACIMYALEAFGSSRTAFVYNHKEQNSNGIQPQLQHLFNSCNLSH